MQLEKIAAVVLLLLYINKRASDIKKWVYAERNNHKNKKYKNRNIVVSSCGKTEPIKHIKGALYEGKTNDLVKFLAYSLLDMLFLVIFVPFILFR
jgi:hypothetical protein